jgi:hypothetical protein
VSWAGWAISASKENNMLEQILLALQVVLLLELLWLLKQLWANSGMPQFAEKENGFLLWLVEQGVWAAEQAWKSGIIQKELREAYVIRFIESMATKYNIKIDEQQILIFIKAVVARVLNRDKLTQTDLELIMSRLNNSSVNPSIETRGKA